MTNIIKSTTTRVAFLLTDSTDNETGELTLSGTVTVEISKNGLAFAAVTGSVVEVPTGGKGWYYVDLSTTETDTTGPLILEAYDTGTNIWREKYEVVDNVPTQITAATAADVDALFNELADHVLKRTFASALASADGDGGVSPTFRTLMGVIAKQTNRTAMSGSTLNIYEDDDATVFGSQTATTNASADPITELKHSLMNTNTTYPIADALKSRIMAKNESLMLAKVALEEMIELAHELSGAPEGYILRDLTSGFEPGPEAQMAAASVEQPVPSNGELVEA